MQQTHLNSQMVAATMPTNAAGSRVGRAHSGQRGRPQGQWGRQSQCSPGMERRACLVRLHQSDTQHHTRDLHGRQAQVPEVDKHTETNCYLPKTHPVGSTRGTSN